MLWMRDLRQWPADSSPAQPISRRTLSPGTRLGGTRSRRPSTPGPNQTMQRRFAISNGVVVGWGTNAQNPSTAASPITEEEFSWSRCTAAKRPSCEKPVQLHSATGRGSGICTCGTGGMMRPVDAPRRRAQGFCSWLPAGFNPAPPPSFPCAKVPSSVNSPGANSV